MFSVPESKNTEDGDPKKIREILGIVTDGTYLGEDSTHQRLGKKKPDGTRPLLVRLPNSEKKTSIMRNLKRLQGMGEPYDSIRVKHDMSVEDRNHERDLQKEAKDISDREKDSNFVYLVR